MQVFCKDIISYMELLAPPSLAEEFDNVGLMVGNFEKEIKRVLLCLDVTSQIVEEALSLRADLIISHHPLIFKKIGSINENELKGSILYKLIKADIGVFSTHTNLDAAECGVNRELAEKLELTGLELLKQDSDKSAVSGMGFAGNLKEPVSVKEFIAAVKEKLQTPSIRLVGPEEGRVKRIAVFCGSFDGDLMPVIAQKVEVLVTGDLKYHTAVDAVGQGLRIIDAGHFNTEKIILPVLDKLISERFPGIEVFCSSKGTDPFKTY